MNSDLHLVQGKPLTQPPQGARLSQTGTTPLTHAPRQGAAAMEQRQTPGRRAPGQTRHDILEQAEPQGHRLDTPRPPGCQWGVADPRGRREAGGVEPFVYLICDDVTTLNVSVQIRKPIHYA